MVTLWKYFLLVACLSILAIISPDIRAQQSIPSGEWVVNLPSSPLSLSVVSKGKVVRFDSHSTGDIIGFRIGCITQEKDIFSVVEMLNERHSKIPAGLYYEPGTPDPIIAFFPISAFESEKNHCEQLKAKVSVVAVEFSDGATWKAKD